MRRPVAADACATPSSSSGVHHCTAAGEPLQTRSVTTKELADAPEADRLLLVTLDGSGWATGGETFAGC